MAVGTISTHVLTDIANYSRRTVIRASRMYPEVIEPKSLRLLE